ncbi:MAG TPA: multicopper oxidase domain-containing protein [Gemmatimonadaceae bacterium]
MSSRTRKQLLTTILIAAAIVLGSLAQLGARRGDTIQRTDFGRVARATNPVYDARLAPPSDADVKEFRIPIQDATIQIAKGTSYQGWTFGGTVPGPVVRVRVGDRVRVTVVNETPMPHSIDFHAARIPANVAYRMIMPRDSISFEFTARDPGAFLVHCGTPPVILHLMQGMYFPMIVDPRDGWGTKADKEFVLVQSEFYAKTDEHQAGAAAPTTAQPDLDAAMKKDARFVVFNGRAFQYKDQPLQVSVGDRVRLFVVNAGPSLDSDFHIVGAVFDRVYPDGNPAHVLTGVQTYQVPAGGGAVFETTFDADGSGEGLYAFVSHSFADAEKGAVGLIRVGTPTQFAHMDH